MKKYVVTLLSAVLIMCCMTGCSQEIQQQTDPLTGEVLLPDVPEEVFYTETPYGNLAFPVDYQQNIRIETAEENEVYTVAYAAVLGEKTIKLYDLHFGGETGDELGTIHAEQGDVTLRVYFYDVDMQEYTDEELEVLAALSIKINTILEHLNAENTFTYAG